MKLTSDDVNEILRLIDSSSFDELRLEDGSFKLHISRGANSGGLEEVGSLESVPAVAFPAPSRDQTAPEQHRAAESPSDSGAGDGLIELRAPMLGTFYIRPKPGSEPFVAVGAIVDPDAVVCIIEVMKLMNSIPAGVRGEVVQICAAEGEIVEYDQVLIRLRPVVS